MRFYEEVQYGGQLSSLKKQLRADGLFRTVLPAAYDLTGLVSEKTGLSVSTFTERETLNSKFGSRSIVNRGVGFLFVAIRLWCLLCCRIVVMKCL